MSGPDTPRCQHCFEATNATPCPHCGWQLGQDNPPPALALGRVLDGRYRVGRVLGHGGFGITYLAWDDNLHLRLAIKEYLPRDCASRGPDGVSLAVYSGPAGDQFAYGLDRFLEEARTLAHFDQHPGIVTVKNFFRAHGTGYCVMDYVAGITLRQYLDQQPGGRISVADALKLLTPVMDALRAVHKDGLLHRDLAPDNIYLTQDGRIKLLDFGAARFATSEHSKSLSIILKPGYAPEEQYRTRGRQGPWTDVYGLAATLYRAITGQVPPESLDRLDHDDLVPPSRLGVAITPGQEATLLQALAVKAGQRWQGMAELQQAWRDSAVAAPQPVGESSGPVEPKADIAATVKPRPWAMTVIFLALGVLLLSLATVALIRFPWQGTTQPSTALTGGAAPSPPLPTPMPTSATNPGLTTATATIPTALPAATSAGAPAELSVSVPAPVVSSTLPTATPSSNPSADAQVGSATPAGATPTAVTPPPLPVPATTAAPPSAPAAPEEKAPLYYAGELAPTANIPPESPLCYKFMVAGPEEQLKKLKNKYSEIYDEKIQRNPDGSKTLIAKRKDETGKEISYYYSTDPVECNEYQRHRIGANADNNPKAFSIDAAQREKLWEIADKLFQNRNYISGIKILQPLIDASDTEVLLRLGRRYAEHNLDESARWYRMATDQLQQEAEKGNKSSSYTLAGLYEFGYGVTKNPSKAEYWYRKSADQGNLVDQKIPAQEYQCVYTTVKKLGTRLLNTPGSGTVITFNNGIHLISYEFVQQAEMSRKNDKVKMCLMELPVDCPPGDERGKVYTIINLRTNRVFNMQNSAHGCGGA